MTFPFPTFTPTQGFTFSATISVDTANYDVRAAAVSAGWNEAIPLLASVVVNAGVYLYSTSTATPAIDTGATFPTGSSVSLVNNGFIYGAGGAGGNGNVTPSAGGSGGTAIKAQVSTIVVNNGVVAGGGGGGPGRDGTGGLGTGAYGGGGGGAGKNVGDAGSSGGGAGYNVTCDPGTLTLGGAGYYGNGASVRVPNGSDGGALGAAGTVPGGGGYAAAGAAGKYVEGIANVTWSGNAGVGGSS